MGGKRRLTSQESRRVLGRPPATLTLVQVARHFHVDRITVYYWVAKGWVEATRVGLKQFRIPGHEMARLQRLYDDSQTSSTSSLFGDTLKRVYLSSPKV